MRLEATVPESRGNAAAELALELGLTRSQLIDEALALFLKAVIEVRRGRKLFTMDPSTSQPACELATPTLAALEWASMPHTLNLGAEALTKLKNLVDAPPEPGKRLKAAAKRQAR